MFQLITFESFSSLNNSLVMNVINSDLIHHVINNLSSRSFMFAEVIFLISRYKSSARRYAFPDTYFGSSQAN